MITVKLENKNNVLNKIIIKGHSGYANYGNDIVCAAVSVATILTINNILSLNKEAIDHQENDGMIISIKKYDDTNKILINNLLNCLRELESNYPKNIQIKEENNE